MQKRPRASIVSTGLLLGALAGATLPALPAFALSFPLLYDIDFSSDTVGAPPATSGAFDEFPLSHPSNQVGNLTVVASAGPLEDQPLHFTVGPNPPDQHLQINQLYLDLEYSRHFSPFIEIAFEATVLDLGPIVLPYNVDSSFGAWLDTPQGIRRVDFNYDGTISKFVSGSESTIGTYRMGEKLDVAIGVDLVADQWSIAVDGSTLFLGDFGVATALTTVRFGLATPTISGNAAIDNIRVTTVPEPATAALLILGLAVLGAKSRALSGARSVLPASDRTSGT